MFTWIKSLFSSMDRQQAAADRAARAMEDIADDLEAVRDQMRSRLGLEAPTPTPEPVKVLPVVSEVEPEKKSRSRSRS